MPEMFAFEGRMHSTKFRWGMNLLLIAVIVLTAELGRQFGIPSKTLQITVLWPPTGIALAALLLYGYRVLPGIFIGNLIYNCSHLLLGSSALINPIITGIVISSGSTLQALVSSYIIKKLSSPGYFNNLRDILIFLFPAGMFSCIVASTIGVTALYLSGNIDVNQIQSTWLTFWLGDTQGVFLFTPVIVVLAAYKIPNDMLKRRYEALLMSFLFVIFSWITYVLNYPFTYFAFPFVVWVVYRFRMHGAVIAMLLFSLTAVVATAMGYGPIVRLIQNDPLIYLVSFLQVIIGISLVMASLLNERKEAWDKLEEYSKTLETKVKQKTQELKEAQGEIFVKEKLASLGLLTAGIGREIKDPLKYVESNVQASQDCLSMLFVTFNNVKTSLDPATMLACENNLECLKNYLQQIEVHSIRADKAIDLITEQSVLSKSSKVVIKSINLHTLINKCLSATVEHNREMKVEITKNFDSSIGMISVEPEDLTHALMNIFESIFFFLKATKERLGKDFSPQLFVQTVGLSQAIKIHLKDNDTEVTAEIAENMFEPFLHFGETGGLGLAVAHDIIVQEHHGEIRVHHPNGQRFEIEITLPKTHITP